MKLTGVWVNGPEWLPNSKDRPDHIVPKATKETEKETKKIREVFVAAVIKCEFNDIMEKYHFWKAVRITAWKQVKWWIKREQQAHSKTERFQEDKLHFNLQKNVEGIHECRGRIQGDYPSYLPPRSTLSKKIVEDAHWCTLHGGVGLTTAFVRQTYWIPRLSLSRAVHIELMPDLTTQGFITALKHFIARRGRPEKIYSDNEATFVGAEKWLRSIMKDEAIQDYLAHQLCGNSV
ncbi:hypothetical protein AC249_AIPGENE5251 [Exaiptasia diaphana]|nr:hypothetical protein AC249_AIPGENE5251 [Exaiptasia diaphana]